MQCYLAFVSLFLSLTVGGGVSRSTRWGRVLSRKRMSWGEARERVREVDSGADDRGAALWLVCLTSPYAEFAHANQGLVYTEASSFQKLSCMQFVPAVDRWR